ncbi:MAG: hypothetical protein ACI4QR_02335, partial [Eubacteriales bacterium]
MRKWCATGAGEVAFREKLRKSFAQHLPQLWRVLTEVLLPTFLRKKLSFCRVCGRGRKFNSTP